MGMGPENRGIFWALNLPPLMLAIPLLQGPLEGVGPENRDSLEINIDMESA